MGREIKKPNAVFYENNPRGGCEVASNVPSFRNQRKVVRFCEVWRLKKKERGPGAKFGVDSHSRKGKTNTRQHSNNSKVQGSPGERQSPGRGYGVLLKGA